MISVLWLLPKGEASAVRTCLGRSAFLFFVASSSDSTMSLRPVVFIGSSSEGRPVAEAIQTTLNGNEVEAVLWTTLFEPSYLTIEALDQKSDDFDFALFVFSSDDVLESRGTRGPAPRDNILLEFGLFVGRTGGESGSSTPFGPVTDRSCRAISLARRVSSIPAQVRSA